jgi:hypothetical protein
MVVPEAILISVLVWDFELGASHDEVEYSNNREKIREAMKREGGISK